MRQLLFGAAVLFTLLSCNREQMVLISTNHGDIKLKLYEETPLHKENFFKLVNEGYFDSLLFHRVINEFMVQGGDPNSKNATKNAALGSGGPGYTIPAEFNSKLIHKKGALAAARMPDQMNPEKASSGSQFYIVHGKKVAEQELSYLENKSGIKYSEEQKTIYKTIGGTPFLDNNYTVFGEVVEGIEVVDNIADVSTNPRDRPIEDVIMKQVKVVKK